MHAEKMVQRFFETHLGAIHDSRRQVLGSLVWMAMLGSALSLSRLARSLAQRGGTMKSGLKRVDRYVGHPRVESEQAHAARALLALSGVRAIIYHESGHTLPQSQINFKQRKQLHGKARENNAESFRRFMERREK